MSSRNVRTAIVMLVLVNALWGMSFPIMKILNQQVDRNFQVTSESASTALRVASASGMIGIRFGLASLFLLLMFRNVVTRATYRDWRAGSVLGCVFFIGLVLQVCGLATIPASRSGFLTSLTAVFTPLASTLLRRKLPLWTSIVGACLAMTGVSILTGLIIWTPQGFCIPADAIQRWTIGDSLTTLGAMFFTIQLLLIDYFGKRRHDSVALTPGMFVTVCVLGCIAFIGLKSTVPAVAPGAWLSLTSSTSFLLLIPILSIFCSVMAFTWMNQYQPALSAPQASVVYSLEPVFASTWALFLPGYISSLLSDSFENESPSISLLVGGAVVMIANLVALWPTTKSK